MKSRTALAPAHEQTHRQNISTTDNRSVLRHNTAQEHHPSYEMGGSVRTVLLST